MNRRIVLGHTAAALAALALPAEAAPTLPAECTPGRAPVFAVASVIDGATIALADGRVVTLAGIDAPLPPLGTLAGPSPVAEAATAALTRVVAGAAVRVAVVGDKPDRYGRLRANVFKADGKPVAGSLVSEGLARVHRLTGDPACVLALLDGERGARIDGRGMWSDPAYKIRSAADASLGAETGLYELVAGKVLSVGHGDVMIFVNFGRDYDEDFTVMVTPAVAKTLATAGLDIDALAGQARPGPGHGRGERRTRDPAGRCDGYRSARRWRRLRRPFRPGTAGS